MNQPAGLASVKRRPDMRWSALAVGDVVESPGITIGEAHLVQWAGLTGDWVSLHLDAQYAAATPFGERIAHGPLTLSIALGLLTQTGYFSNVAAWLGVDEVRDRLRRLRVTLLYWVPSGLRRLLEGLRDGVAFPDVRMVVLGSEPLTGRDVAAFRRHFRPDAVLANRYGATETGNLAHYLVPDSVCAGPSVLAISPNASA